MEVSSCQIDGNFFCIWVENDLFNLEDVSRQVLVPLHPFQFLWFEQHMDRLTHSPVHSWFSFQNHDALDTCRLQKFKSNQSLYLEWVVWPTTGGRKIAIIPAGPEMSGWKKFWFMLKNFSVRTAEEQMRLQKNLKGTVKVDLARKDIAMSGGKYWSNALPLLVAAFSVSQGL